MLVSIYDLLATKGVNAMAPSTHSPIAIIGFAYRAPGTGRKGLYDFLAEAKSAFSPIPKDRFEQGAYCYNDPEKAGIFAPKGAHFLPDDIYAFDAPFFNMNGEEVTSMDPQHRKSRLPFGLTGKTPTNSVWNPRHDARMRLGSSRKCRNPTK